MNCPKHPETEMEKVRLDNYGCQKCGYQWLIHPYNNKKGKEKVCPVCKGRYVPCTTCKGQGIIYKWIR